MLCLNSYIHEFRILLMLYNIGNLFELVSQQVQTKLLKADSCHDFDHTLRVLANAETLLNSIPAADADTVRLAVLLHDSCRPEENNSCGKLCHAALGAEFAAGLLASLGLSEAEYTPIVRAIATHRFRDGNHPCTIEEKIVYDADKLDSLGAVGIGRAFLFAGNCGARLHNTAGEALAGSAYGKEDTAYREYLVKLRKLPAAMLTEPGRKIAGERAAFMETFFEQLNMETNLNL